GDTVTVEVRPHADAQAAPLGELYLFSSDMLFEAEPKQEQETLPDGGYRVLLKIAETAPADVKRIEGILAASEGWGEQMPGLLLDVPLVSVQEDDVAATATEVLPGDMASGVSSGAPFVLILGGAF